MFREHALLPHLFSSDAEPHLGGIVKGPVLKTGETGGFLDVADHCVWYSPESGANALSLHQLVVDGHSPCYDPLKTVFVGQSPSLGVLEFPWDDHAEHHVCDYGKHLSKCHNKKTVCHPLATIADNESQHPKRLMKAVCRDSALIVRRLGSPSTGNHCRADNSGIVTNEVVSVQELARAQTSNGPSCHLLRARPTCDSRRNYPSRSLDRWCVDRWRCPAPPICPR